MTTDTLYERDFVTWTERQAHALRDAGRQGANLPIDWELVAEEIEDLGNEVRNKVRSLAFQIQVHLLKIACSSAAAEGPHWMNEVDEFRAQLARRLEENQALRSGFDELSSAEADRAVRTAERLFRRSSDTAALPRLANWKLRGIAGDEVVADGTYPKPGTLTFRIEAE